jgi:hypothetical protein
MSVWNEQLAEPIRLDADRTSKYTFTPSLIFPFLYQFCFYCSRSRANLNSAVSFSRITLSFSSLVYFNNLSQACISDSIMSFLSLQRLWYESTNEYVTFLFVSLRPQVLATMS